MRKPFFIIDNKHREIKVCIGSAVKVTKFSDIEKNQDFFDELFRRFKQVNFVSHFSEMGKRDVSDIIEDICSENNGNLNQINKKEEVVEKRVVDKEELSTNKNEEIYIDENSNLIRKNTDRKIYLEDLDFRFDDNHTYMDLSVMDQNKVESSNQLKVLLDRGFLVKTSMQEIAKIAKSDFEDQKKRDQKRRDRDIIDRDGSKSTSSNGTVNESVSDGEMLIEGDGEIPSNEGVGSMSSLSVGGVDQPVIDDETVIGVGEANISAGEIKDFFYNQSSKSNDENMSINDLLKQT